MRTSVRRWVTVENNTDVSIVHYGQQHSSVQLIREVFGPRAVPRCKRYLVEYRIDPRGRYKVEVHGVVCRDESCKAVCFLPNSWIGQCVSRKIIEKEL